MRVSRDKGLLLIIQRELNYIELALQERNCKSADMLREDWFLQRMVTQSVTTIYESIRELTNEFKENNNNINWAQFKKTRDIASHNYDAINFKIVWSLIFSNFKVFKMEIDQIIDSIN